MLKVRFIISGVTRKALEFQEAEINEWAEKTGVIIKGLRHNFGQAPTGMSGTLENALFISILYEPKKPDQENPKRRAADKSAPVENPEQKVYIRHTDKSDTEARTLRKK